MVYDDINLASNTTITGVFANFLDLATSYTTATWEIRSGMSAGNGGTLEATGSGATATIATGRNGFGLDEFQVTVAGLSVNLSAGTYYLGFALDNINAGTAGYISTTSGTDEGPGGDPNPAVTGSPIANGNTFFNSTAFVSNFVDTQDQFGPGTWDFSMGVNGVVPEPATFVVLGSALVSLVALRRRRS
jgi:hypothetical protein